jgi:hypothetical protein
MTEAECRMVETEIERVKYTNDEPSNDYKKLAEELLAKWDALILNQAETFGWRLTTSEKILQRFSQWAVMQDGPELFERFGKALARAVRIEQGKKSPPIEDLRESKPPTVAQLRLVLKNLRGEFAANRTRPTMTALLERFAAIIVDDPEAFDYLYPELTSWQKFFKDVDPIDALIFRPGPLSPASLYDNWVACRTLRDQDSVRQILSRNSKI